MPARNPGRGHRQPSAGTRPRPRTVPPAATTVRSACAPFRGRTQRRHGLVRRARRTRDRTATTVPLRIELETGSDLARRFWLQVPRNDGAWTRHRGRRCALPVADPAGERGGQRGVHAWRSQRNLLPARAPPSVAVPAWVHEATTHPSPAPACSPNEWPLVIRRVRRRAGATTPATASIPHGRHPWRMRDRRGTRGHPACAAFHLGGTSWRRLARSARGSRQRRPVLRHRTLRTTNVLMMVKSSDGGRRLARGGRARTGLPPTTSRLATAFAADTVHAPPTRSLATTRSAPPTTPRIPYLGRARRTGGRAGKPPTQVAALASRSDGSLVGVHGGPQRIHYRIRTRDGQWGAETVIDADTARGLSGPMLATGKHDVVHLAYTGNDGTAWYRRIAADGQLSPRQQLADNLATAATWDRSCPGVPPDTDSVAVLYRTRAATSGTADRRPRAHRQGHARQRTARGAERGRFRPDRRGRDRDGRQGPCALHRAGNGQHLPCPEYRCWPVAAGGLQSARSTRRGARRRSATPRSRCMASCTTRARRRLGMNRYGEVDPAR